MKCTCGCGKNIPQTTYITHEKIRFIHGHNARLQQKYFIQTKCIGCGKKIFREPYRIKRCKNNFCSKICKGIYMSNCPAEESPHWKNGYNKTTQGYIQLNGKKFKRILEHRFIMQEKIKRKLRRNEIVHHKNNNKEDNRIENLEIITRSNHTKLHWKLRLLKKQNKF